LGARLRAAAGVAAFVFDAAVLPVWLAAVFVLAAFWQPVIVAAINSAAEKRDIYFADLISCLIVLIL